MGESPISTTQAQLYRAASAERNIWSDAESFYIYQFSKSFTNTDALRELEASIIEWSYICHISTTLMHFGDNIALFE